MTGAERYFKRVKEQRHQAKIRYARELRALRKRLGIVPLQRIPVDISVCQ